MAPIAVFDIDGVLADVQHRVHHVQAPHRNWRAFFAAAHLDPLLPHGAALLRTLQDDHEIRYLTGRPERLRRVTRAWLERQGLPTDQLRMRPARDFRPARVFKREQLREWMAQGAVIAAVIDDDPQVVAMVRELGLAAVQATWQDGELTEQEALWAAQEELGRT